MARLCERPGCSEEAAVAYGMRPEDLVFWLDSLRSDGSVDHGALCRRHADSMVVPRGWTLDDLRDPDLHLFRPPAPVDVARPRRRRSSGPGGDATQLAFTPLADPERTSEGDERAEPAGTPDELAPEGWAPSFDTDDDLDGLLSPRSPLLSRAFRGGDRTE